MSVSNITLALRLSLLRLWFKHANSPQTEQSQPIPPSLGVAEAANSYFPQRTGQGLFAASVRTVPYIVVQIFWYEVFLVCIASSEKVKAK